MVAFCKALTIENTYFIIRDANNDVVLKVRNNILTSNKTLTKEEILHIQKTNPNLTIIE
jgi:hypothetical protein